MTNSRTWLRTVPAALLAGALSAACSTGPAAGGNGSTALSRPAVSHPTTIRPATSHPATSHPATGTGAARAVSAGASRPHQGAAPSAATAVPHHTEATAPQRRGDDAWSHPRPSVHTAPGALLAHAHVPATRPVRVVSVRNVHGRPRVVVATAPHDRAVGTIAHAQAAPGAVSVSLDGRVHAAALRPGTMPSNDPGRSQQWALTRLDAEDLWKQQPGNDVVVAVVDSGVQGTHPDLVGEVLQGTDLVTPGGNGFADGAGHGTHVAGIIAATAGNGVGVAGLAQGVEVLPVRALDDSGSGWDSDIASGIIYATDHGASVINLSLGGGASDAMASAISYATTHGVVVVAAAGNERQQGNAVSYPAADPGVIGVAASDSSDTIASFSNTGSYVDLSAPGVDIVSTYPGSAYMSMSGTSMATPYVAATAALLEAASPGITPAQVTSALESTADDLGTSGRDDMSGYGLVDPGAALCSLVRCTGLTTPAPTTTTPTAPATQPVPPPAGPVTSPTPTPTPSPTVGAPPSPEPSNPQPTTPAPGPGAPGPGTAAPVVTTTTLVNRPRPVRYGDRIRVTVRVLAGGSPLPGTAVRLCLRVRPATGYSCRRLTTDATGRAHDAFTARARTTVFAAHPGSATSAASTSSRLVYTVTPRLALVRHPRALTVRLRAPRPEVVTLHRWRHGHWTLARRARVSSRPHTFSRLPAGRYQLRVAASRSLRRAVAAVRIA